MISTLQFEPEQGSNNNTVTVTCSAITGRASRSTTITVAAKDTTTYPTLKKTISVTQTGKPEFILADQVGSPVHFAATVTTFSISGSSNSAKLTVDRKSTRLNSSHQIISYAVFCLKKKK